MVSVAVVLRVAWLATCHGAKLSFMHQDADLLSRAVMWTEDSTIPLASPFVECNHGGAINFAVQGIKDQAVVDHPLVLLEGNVDFPKRMPSLLPLPSCSVLYVRIQYIVTLWAVTLPSGHFKALIHLPSPGLHFVKLWSPLLPSYRCLNSLLYRPPLTSLEKSSSTTTISPFRLRFTLQTCPDTNGTIDAPLGSDNSLTAALSILQFNAILLQTIMAQLQSAHHLPPHTFAFDSLDALGQPVVDAWSTPELTTSTMAALDDQENFRVIRRELNPNATDSNLLHVVVTGCCRYNAMTRRAVGHAAVGADGTPRVALFGGCGLHAWASSVHDVVKKLTDTTRIPSYLMDDSGHRGTMGGLYTTGLGALLHEMGHAFGLGHSPPGFIMSRGGDDLHRVLSLFGMDGAPLKDMGGARWHRANAIKLHHSPFLRRESPALAFAGRRNGPSIQWRHNLLGPAGLAYMDGPQRPFKVSISKGCIHMGLLLDIGDVRIAPDKDGGDDMLFCLATGEVVVAVTVHAVAWVDGIQLHTSTRSTQVFGHANDVPPVRLAAPHGMYVHALEGTLGDRRIGRLGVSIAPLHMGLPDDKTCSASHIAAMDSIPRSLPGLPRGASTTKSGHIVNTSCFPTWKWTNVDDIPLRTHEQIVQLDVARDGNGIVCGLGLHSPERAFPWQGVRTDALEFYIAPPGWFIESFEVRRDGVDAKYTRFVTSRQGGAPTPRRDLRRCSTDQSLRDDVGEVNVQVLSPLGIAAIFLTQRNQGYDLVDHVLPWPSSSSSSGRSSHAVPYPNRWFLSYSWWRHVIGKNATPSDYILEVLDVAGATTREPCEAMYYDERA